MYCTPKEYIGFIGAMAFAGATIACFFLPILGDKYGRWIIFEITMGIQIPLYLMALTTRSLWVKLASCVFVSVSWIVSGKQTALWFLRIVTVGRSG